MIIVLTIALIAKVIGRISFIDGLIVQRNNMLLCAAAGAAERAGSGK